LYAHLLEAVLMAGEGNIHTTIPKSIQ
jgi:hypothetical protein